MKFKKSLVKVIIIWSIFFISSMSSVWLISMQDENLNNFWTVAKLDTSFINSTYADDDEYESHESYETPERSTNQNYRTPERSTNQNYRTSERSTNQNYRTSERSTNQNYKNEDNINSKTTTSIPVILTKEKENKQIVLNDLEKQSLIEKFDNVVSIINKKYNSDSEKLVMYKKLNSLVNKKISTLESIKSYITKEIIIKKYEKKRKNNGRYFIFWRL